MKHCGVHWPNGPEKFGLLSSLPGSVWLMTSPEARYHYDKMRKLGKVVIWRDVPAPGNRPAELGWNTHKAADAAMVLWGEQPHYGIEHFQSHCELTLNYERGDNEDDFQNLNARHTRLARFLADLEPQLRQRLPAGTLLHFPPWVPDERAYDRVSMWRDVANQYDVISIHQYGPPEAILAQVQWHLDTWPTKGVLLSEWHNDEPEITLQLLAELADREPRFLGATWFIAHWYNAPGDWPTWKNLQDNMDLYRIFLNPPVVTTPIPEPEPEPMTEIEAFIRDAAQKRGINPDIAVKVAKSEGSVTDPAAHGDFETGDSWWPFQLHYGGPEYPQYGTVAGMGNGFTKLTGWQPGDPKAWRDSVRYALNRAKASGWSAWYGAAAVGVGPWDGIDRTHPWDANSEHWDFETGGGSVPKVTFNPDYPAVLQDDEFSCAPTSLTWAMRSVGRTPADNWIESDMIRLGYVTRELGLMNHTGAGIVEWLGLPDAIHYGPDGYGISNNTNPISWEQLVPEIDPHPPYPILLGLPNWGGAGAGHWAGVRGFKEGRILLANPATGATFGHQSLSQGQFNQRAGGNASLVRVLHPDLIGTPEPPPPPVDPKAGVREKLAAVEAAVAALRAELAL